jgi:SAM-dependent methyltransferase
MDSTVQYFDKRATEYLYALNIAPDALSEEWVTAVQMCDLQAGHALLTIPSSCERIRPYLPPDVKLYQFETTLTLAQNTDIPCCSFDAIPLPDQSIDRILCLATLHHETENSRMGFYKECLRLLRPGGKLIIGDVEVGTGLAGWLNTFVDQHNPYGHTGMFFTEDDMAPLRHAGFQTCSVHRTDYTWNFCDRQTMIEFTRHLFMLECSDEEIWNGLSLYLSPTDINYRMGLLYIVGLRP